MSAEFGAQAAASDNVYPFGDEHQCKLLAGPAALSAQLVLFSAVSATLIYKWLTEVPRRPCRTWALDIGKQVVSTCAAHTCGMLIAIIASGQSGKASQCAWYFIVFLTDTTLGMCVAISLHSGIVMLARHAQRRRRELAEAASTSAMHAPMPDAWWEAFCEPGRYGDPVQYSRWLLQLLAWVTCTVLGRVVCGVLIIGSRRMFEWLTLALDRMFVGKQDEELFFVMVACPMVMNALQAYIQDHVLKGRLRAAATKGSSTSDSNDTSGDSAVAAANPAATDGKGEGKASTNSKPVVVVMEAS